MNRVASRLRAVIGRPAAPWSHGLWVSVREHYERVDLPPGFVVKRPVLVGEQRRVAHHAGGVGRPILILPGLYADLHERLFVEIAAAAARLKRPVWVLEDRLAAETVAQCGPPRVRLDKLGMAVSELASQMSSSPDVLALSAGLLSAWTAPSSLHRVIGFSGVRSPAVTARTVAGNPLIRAHFEWLHRRVDLPFAFEALLEFFARQPVLDPPDVDWLLVHAEDDPVVPVSSLDGLRPERVCRLAAGGHLGFGVLAGPEVYLIPLLEDDDV